MFSLAPWQINKRWTLNLKEAEEFFFKLSQRLVVRNWIKAILHQKELGELLSPKDHRPRVFFYNFLLSGSSRIILHWYNANTDHLSVDLTVDIILGWCTVFRFLLTAFYWYWPQISVLRAMCCFWERVQYLYQQGKIKLGDFFMFWC